MDPEVGAALIAFVAAAITVAMNSWASRRDAQERQQGELFTSALDHLVGKSQPRSVGIAALSVFLGVEPTTGTARWPRSKRSRLDRYGSAVARLLSSQLTYLLVHGENRGQAHEIGNIVAIGRLLFAPRLLDFVDGQQRQILLDAMKIYANHPFEVADRNAPTSHFVSVRSLRDIIDTEWVPRLGSTPAVAA